MFKFSEIANCTYRMYRGLCWEVFKNWYTRDFLDCNTMQYQMPEAVYAENDNNETDK